MRGQDGISYKVKGLMKAERAEGRLSSRVLPASLARLASQLVPVPAETPDFIVPTEHWFSVTAANSLVCLSITLCPE